MVLASRGNDPPPHFKPMPHYTTWGGTYVTRPVAIEDRDYSDNDYDFNDFVIESTQADALTDNLSGTAGPGGSTFRTDNLAGDVDGDSDVAPVIETDFQPEVDKAVVINSNLQGDITGIRDTDIASESLIDDMMTGIRHESPSHQLDTKSIPCYTEFFRAAEGDVDGLQAHPGGTGSKIANPLDQMGFIKPSDDEVTNNLQTSWKGSWDKFSIFNDDVGVTATQLQESCANATFVKGGQLGYTEVEWTYLKGDVWTNGSATSIRDGVTGSGFHGGLANGAVHPDTPMDTHPNDNLLGYPGAGSEDLVRPFSEMNQGDPFSELDQGFETGLPVGSKLRSDNRFVIEPVNLFQDLDAGNALDSRLINPVSLINPDSFLPFTVDGEGNNP